MGKISIFVEAGCSGSQHVRELFEKHHVPFNEVSLSDFPGRRVAMIQISNSVVTPQVLFNEQHVGGVRAIVKRFKDYEAKEESEGISVLDQITNELGDGPLIHQSKILPTTGKRQNNQQRESLIKDHDLVEFPDKTFKSVSSITSDLIKTLQDDQTKSILQMFNVMKLFTQCSTSASDGGATQKSSFKGKEVIKVLMKEYKIPYEAQAIPFGQKLVDLRILHPVKYDVFDANGLFQLQPLKLPKVLNTFRIWTDDSGYAELFPDPRPFATLSSLFKKMVQIISAETDGNGRVDYEAIRSSRAFHLFERDVCQLQLINVKTMGELSRKAFFINVYHLLMMHAFVRTKPKKARNFFTDVQYMIGGFVLSLDDIFHGILRCNSAHPITGTKMFTDSSDHRRSLCLNQLDDRIHFAINEVGGSSSLMYEYHEDAIGEELRVLTELLFTTEGMVSINVKSNTLTIPAFMGSYLTDFNLEHLFDMPKFIIQYLRGDRFEQVQNMISNNGKVTIIFQGSKDGYYKMDSSKFKKLRACMIGEHLSSADRSTKPNPGGLKRHNSRRSQQSGKVIDASQQPFDIPFDADESKQSVFSSFSSLGSVYADDYSFVDNRPLESFRVGARPPHLTDESTLGNFGVSTSILKDSDTVGEKSTNSEKKSVTFTEHRVESQYFNKLYDEVVPTASEEEEVSTQNPSPVKYIVVDNESDSGDDEGTLITMDDALLSRNGAHNSPVHVADITMEQRREAANNLKSLLPDSMSDVNRLQPRKMFSQDKIDEYGDYDVPDNTSSTEESESDDISISINSFGPSTVGENQFCAY